MPAWLLVAPPDTRKRPAREQYLQRVGQDGRPELTPHAILAKRFAASGVARRWAQQHGELLADFTVARR